MKSIKQVLFLAILLIGFAGCSKDDDGTEIIDREKEFAELSYDEQHEKLTEALKVYAGAEYTLSTIVTNDRNGEPVKSYNASECERKVIISVPDQINQKQIVKQVVDEGGCGQNYDTAPFDLFDYGFKNYKFGLPFYIVSTDDPNQYSGDFFFKIEPTDTPDYLVLYRIWPDEVQNAGGPNYGKTDAHAYQEYVFTRLK